jgi:hypothetical protein
MQVMVLCLHQHVAEKNAQHVEICLLVFKCVVIVTAAAAAAAACRGSAAWLQGGGE